jgi:ubiquinone/menaquinone biosynthesis C-methylase UbiE
MNKKIVDFIDRTFYKRFQTKWDDKLLRETILQYIQPEHVVLDVGAGRGRVLEMSFKGKAKRVVGVDPDARVRENPLLDEGYEGLGDHMPFFNDNTFDIVFCDNVLEHVEHPDKFYKEISRVLKPGGFFISKTPNKYYYVAIIAALTPQSFHKYVNKKRGRNESDTFPTFYRANTPADQAKHAAQNGMKKVESKSVEGRPEYLRLFFFTYVAGLVFERTVNFFGLNSLKAIIISVYKKTNHQN